MPDGEKTSDEERSDGEKRALAFLEFLNQPENTRLREELQRASFELFVKEGADHHYHFTGRDLEELVKCIRPIIRIWGGGGHR